MLVLSRLPSPMKGVEPGFHEVRRRGRPKPAMLRRDRRPGAATLVATTPAGNRIDIGCRGDVKGAHLSKEPQHEKSPNDPYRHRRSRAGARVAVGRQDTARQETRTRLLSTSIVNFGDPVMLAGAANQVLVPDETTIRKGGTVTFVVNGGGHGIAIYPVSKNTTRDDITHAALRPRSGDERVHRIRRSPTAITPLGMAATMSSS